MSLNDFEILKDIGKGSFGSVHKVKRKLDNCIYALKKVRLSKLNMKEKGNAINEIRILASISHPNIVSYKESFYDAEKQILCLVMEYVDCGDLEEKIIEKIKSDQLFSEAEIWSCFIQVLRGLRELHSKKVLHRDIKSANIFLNNDGSVKIGDMNVSKVLKDTLKNTQTGTPFYASPEIWKNERYDFKSDIWSLGCLIYELSARKPPFTGYSMKGVYDNVVRGRYDEIPSSYSNFLRKSIASMLQVRPSKRASSETLLNFIESSFSKLPSYSVFLKDISKKKLCSSSHKSFKEALQFEVSNPEFHQANKELKQISYEEFQPEGDSYSEKAFERLIFDLSQVDSAYEIPNQNTFEKSKYISRKQLPGVNGNSEKDNSKNQGDKSRVNQFMMKTLHFPQKITDLNKILPKKKYALLTNQARANSIAPCSHKLSLDLNNLNSKSRNEQNYDSGIQINKINSFNSDVPVILERKISDVKYLKVGGSLNVISEGNCKGNNLNLEEKLNNDEANFPNMIKPKLDIKISLNEDDCLSPEIPTPVFLQQEMNICSKEKNPHEGEYVIKGNKVTRIKQRISDNKLKVRVHSSISSNYKRPTLERANPNKSASRSISTSKDDQDGITSNSKWGNSPSKSAFKLRKDDNIKEDLSDTQHNSSKILPNVQTPIQSNNFKKDNRQFNLSNANSRNIRGPQLNMKTNVDHPGNLSIGTTNTHAYNNNSLCLPLIVANRRPQNAILIGNTLNPQNAPIKVKVIPEYVTPLKKIQLKSNLQVYRGLSAKQNKENKDIKSNHKLSIQSVAHAAKLKMELAITKYKKPETASNGS